MQHLNTLSQLVSAASTVAELARASQSYSFNVSGSVTCYLHLTGGEVRLSRRTEPLVEIVAQLQAPFAWRIGAEQDTAGVYFVALRRPLVGAMADASFYVSVPNDCHLVLKLEGTRLCLENVSGTMEIPPRTANLSIVPRLP